MTAHNTAIAAATAGPGLEGAVGRWVYVGADGIARLQTDPTSNTTSGILVKGESEGELVSIVHSGMCSRFTPGTLIEPWDFVACGVDGSVVKAAGDAVVLGRYVPDVMSVDGMLDASGTKAWGLSIAPLPSGGTLSELDVSGEFVAAYASGNVGFGTSTPANLGAGTKNVEIDSAFLSVIRLLNSGTVLGTILAGFGQLSIATTGVVDLTFGTDGDSRLNLRGDGAVELPTIAGHATEGWAQIAADGTVTRGVSRGNTTWVASVSDFPTPVAGVITLPADTTWIVIDAVDIGSNRIVAAGVVTIKGVGAETSSLSAALDPLESIVTSEYTITLRDLSMSALGATCVTVDGTARPPGSKPACDWAYINFLSGRACTLIDVSNSINTVIGVFGDGYYVETAIDTLAFVDSFFTPGDGQCGICIEAGPPPVVNRRLRVNNCAFIPSGTGIGISAPVSSVDASEGFILSLCTFQGPTPANYIVGVAYTDDEARWIECRGITNTARIGEYNWEGNAVVTVIATQNVPVKIEGVAVAGGFNQRFTIDDNRATYASELSEPFRISAACSLAAANNRVFALQGYLNGVTPIGIPQRSTTNGSGRSESFVWQGLVQMSEGDFVEMWVTNETDDQDVTVEDLSVQVLQA